MWPSSFALGTTPAHIIQSREQSEQSTRTAMQCFAWRFYERWGLKVGTQDLGYRADNLLTAPIRRAMISYFNLAPKCDLVASQRGDNGRTQNGARRQPA